MPNTGDRTRDSILWVPGESTGRDYTGATVAVPASGNLDEEAIASTAYTDTKVNALKTRLVASGVLPN